MRKIVKATPKRATKRDLFDELSEGMVALAEARQGKRTLRTCSPCIFGPTFVRSKTGNRAVPGQMRKPCC